jgi:hypothetical protein
MVKRGRKRSVPNSECQERSYQEVFPVAVSDFPVPVCHVCGCTAISLKDHRLANATCRITQTANTFHASVARERTGIPCPINREVPEFVVEGLLQGINVEDDGFEGVHDMPEEMGYNRINGEDPV